MSCWRKEPCDRLGDASKAEILRGIVTEKLSSATREILAVVERAIAGYEEEAAGYRSELERQKKLLECLLQPRVKLERSASSNAEGGSTVISPYMSNIQVGGNVVFAMEPGPQRVQREAETTGWNGQDSVTIDEGSQDNEKEPHSRPTDVLEDNLGFIWYGDDSAPFDEDAAPETTPSKKNREDLMDPDFEITERSVTPKVPSERRAAKARVNDRILLRVRVLDSTPAVLPKNDPMRLWCPTGLQEADFLQRLRSAIPQLTDEQAFDLYIADQRRNMKPLRVTLMTPENIKSSMGTGKNQTLYIQLKKPGDPYIPPENQTIPMSQAEDHDSSAPPAERRKPGRRARTHFVFKFCVLNDLSTDESSENGRSVLHGSEVQLLQCPCRMEEVEFIDLLKSCFPQLAADNGGFHVHVLDEQQQLHRLPLKVLKPSALHKVTMFHPGKEEVLYIQRKAGEENGEVAGAKDLKEKETPQRRNRGRIYSRYLQEAAEVEAEGDDGQLDAEPGRRGSVEALPRKQHQCKLCSVSYQRKSVLVKHVWSHMAEPQSCCGVCGQNLPSSEELKRHLESHQKIFPCSVCEKVFLREGSLQNHSRMHSSLPSFTCGVCHKAFLNQHQLRMHRPIHAAQKRHKCGLCPKEFSVRALLLAHRKVHHGTRTQCTICPKVLCDKAAMIRHRITHFSERRYCCHVCGKRFKLGQTLRCHLLTHEVQERPFLCHICPKTFVKNCHLNAHLKVHSDARPFMCDVCGRGFGTGRALRCHQPVHSSERRHRCAQCGNTYKHRGNLRMHMRTHAKERRYVCNACGKAFNRKEHLTFHMRTHSGQRPFKCSLCDKTFTQGHCLKTHVKKCHGETGGPAPDTRGSSGSSGN